MQTDAALDRREPEPPAPVRLVSDQQLVEQARAGSDRAFEALFERHHQALLAFCRQMLDSPEEAEDAVQLTFMAAYSDLARAKQPKAWLPWLYGIARHRCLSALRLRRERAVAAVPKPLTDGAGAEVIAREELGAILADMALLPDDQRVALVLSEFGDLPHEDIAGVLGCRRDKVKALVFQARTSLAASRAARETPCAEIREQLATVRGPDLRRTTLRRHLRVCEPCRAFAEDVRAGRRLARVLLPATPAVGLKRGILGALFGSGGAGGTALVADTLSAGGLVAAALATVVIHGGPVPAAVTPSGQGNDAARLVTARGAAAVASQGAVPAIALGETPSPGHARATRRGRSFSASAAVTEAMPAPARPVVGEPSAGPTPDKVSGAPSSDKTAADPPGSDAPSGVADDTGNSAAASKPSPVKLPRPPAPLPRDPAPTGARTNTAAPVSPTAPVSPAGPVAPPAANTNPTPTAPLVGDTSPAPNGRVADTAAGGRDAPAPANDDVATPETRGHVTPPGADDRRAPPGPDARPPEANRQANPPGANRQPNPPDPNRQPNPPEPNRQPNRPKANGHAGTGEPEARRTPPGANAPSATPNSDAHPTPPGANGRPTPAKPDAHPAPPEATAQLGAPKPDTHPTPAAEANARPTPAKPDAHPEPSEAGASSAPSKPDRRPTRPDANTPPAPTKPDAHPAPPEANAPPAAPKPDSHPTPPETSGRQGPSKPPDPAPAGSPGPRS